MQLDAKTHHALIEASSRLASRNHATYLAEALTQVKRHPGDPIGALRLLAEMQGSAFAGRRDQKAALADVGAWLEARLLAEPGINGQRLAVELGWLRRLVVYHDNLGASAGVRGRGGDRPRPFGRQLSKIQAGRQVGQTPVRVEVTRGPAEGSGDEPEVRAALPDQVRVVFAEITQARKRRKLYVKQRGNPKKEIKRSTLVLRVVDPLWARDPRLGLLISTTETEGIDQVFGALAQMTAGTLEFEVVVPPGGRGVVTAAYLIGQHPAA